MKKISDYLKKHNNYYIFPHVSLDGDALGSAVALCKALRQLNKNAYVVYKDEIPEFISFLDDGCVVDSVSGEYVSIAVDWSSLNRVSDRKSEFLGGIEKICIDHHICEEPFTNLSYIDPNKAATGELIFDLLEIMEIEFDVSIATAIYVAIILDTGNFQYSNCTPETHYIAGKLLSFGVDQSDIFSKLYESKSKEEIAIQSLIMSKVRYELGDKVAIGIVSKEDMDSIGAKYSDTEGTIDLIRSIKSVDISCLIKEFEKGLCKVSFRAKGKDEVMEIAKSFGGGGHLKASGATVEGDTEAVYSQLVGKLEEIYG